jgi:hypothetical protein
LVWKGFKSLTVKPFEFQIGQEVLPQMAGGLQADCEIFFGNTPHLKGGKQLGKSFARGVDAKAVLDFFSLGIQEGATMRLQRDINSQIEHTPPWWGGFSTHGGLSSDALVRIAWFVVSDEAGEAPHSILNKCSRPEWRKAAVFLNGSRWPKGGMQVVSPPVENVCTEQDY